MGGPVGNTQINKSTFFNRLLSKEQFRKLWALFRYSDNYSLQWEIQIHVIMLNGGNVYMYAQLKQVEGGRLSSKSLNNIEWRQSERGHFKVSWFWKRGLSI